MSPSNVRDDPNNTDSSELELSAPQEFGDTEEFESLLDEMASVLETEDDLEAGADDAFDDVAWIDSEELVPEDEVADAGEDYHDLRDGPFDLGPIHVVEFKSSAEHLQAEEARWVTDIQLVDDEPRPCSAAQPSPRSSDVLTLDPDDEPMSDVASPDIHEDPEGWFTRVTERLQGLFGR